MDEAIETITFVVLKRDSTLGPHHLDSIRSVEVQARLLLKRLERRGDGALEIEVTECVERIIKNVEMEMEETEEFRNHQVDIDAGSFSLAFPLDATAATTASASPMASRAAGTTVAAHDHRGLNLDDETAVELLLRRAVAGYTQLIGEEHPHLLSVSSTLGRFLPLHGKDLDAEAEEIPTAPAAGDSASP